MINFKSFEDEIEIIDTEIMQLLERRKALVRMKDLPSVSDKGNNQTVRRDGTPTDPDYKDCYFPDI